MKFIVIGLGTLGYTMAHLLTIQGEDVIGVDRNLSKVEEYKQDISSTICLDVSEYYALSSLPIKEVDAIIVALGDDLSTSIEVVAYIKQLGAKKIFARSNSKVETAILKAIGIDKIMTPSEYVAELYSFEVSATGIQGLYVIDDHYRIYEWIITDLLVGQTVEMIDFFKNFKVQLIAIKRKKIEKNLLGNEIAVYHVLPLLNENTYFEKEDQIVVFAKSRDFIEMKKTFE